MPRRAFVFEVPEDFYHELLNFADQYDTNVAMLVAEAVETAHLLIHNRLTENIVLAAKKYTLLFKQYRESGVMFRTVAVPFDGNTALIRKARSVKRWARNNNVDLGALMYSVFKLLIMNEKKASRVTTWQA